MKSKISCLAWCLLLAGLNQTGHANQINIADTSQILTINATPNILLIPDTSESMQEGLFQGRVALDWDNCVPGPGLDPVSCPAGARYENSKASIVKRVSRNLVEEFKGKVNIGLLSYQQNPPSQSRDSFNTGNMVRWRLVERIIDARFSNSATPSWYQPNPELGSEPAWNSPIKRFRVRHPSNNNIWIFFNAAVPGYFWDTEQDRSTGTPTFDQVEFRRFTGATSQQNPPDGFTNVRYGGLTTTSRNNVLDADSGLYFTENLGQISTFLTDSLRQRGITSWGQRAVFLPLNQLEWRTTTSPGLGYLHVPLGGISSNGTVDNNHINKILAKLQPQRLDWASDAHTNPAWPLIAAGLKPVEGAINTAKDYFLGLQPNDRNSSFRSNQGNTGNLSIPQSCGINAAIWVTDGLPSVKPDGTPLVNNPVTAMRDAAAAIKSFYNATANKTSLGGAVKTYIVGFALPPGVGQLFAGQTGFDTDNPLDILAAAGGTNKALSAIDEDSLLQALNQIFRSIIQDSISSSGLTSTSTELTTDTTIFQSALNTQNWSGDLLALSISSGGRDKNTPKWQAAAELTKQGHANRNIFSFYNGQGFEFSTSSAPSQVKNLLKTASQPENIANNLINYVRGDRSNEGSGNGKLRERANIMGHIVNSTPLYVPGEGARPPVIYVMANDGMLHAFNANTGTELFAFIPGAVLGKLPLYASNNYAGEFLLDGQLAYKKVNNSIYLTGTAGTGTQAVFTLNISNPTNFTTSDIVWEASGSAAFDGLLGRTGSQPINAMLGNKHVVLLGNGYNSSSGKSALLAVNLLTGALEKAFTVDGQGFGSPGVLDLDRDNNPDFVYIGDFNGKVWRFALNESLATANGYSTSQHLFTSNNNRPIVVAPVAASHPDGGVMVIFGTGEMLTNGSRISNSSEYVYGIYDKFLGGSAATITPGQLVNQTLTNSGSNRNTTRNPITQDKAGWSLTLPAGERMLANAVVRRQKVIFGSYKPDNTACSGGGQGYMTELALFSGTPVSLTEPASKPVTGIPRTPIFIEIPQGGFPIVRPGCTENCGIIADNKELMLIGEQDEQLTVIKGRQNWREIGR